MRTPAPTALIPEHRAAQPVDAVLEEVAPDSDRWLAFVKAAPAATAFHHPAWVQLLAECYGYRPLALLLNGAGGRPVADLPLLATGGFPWRQRLVALPFTDRCPLLAANPEAAVAMTYRLSEWSASRGAVEVRGELPECGVGACEVSAVRHVLELPPDPEALYRGFRPQLRQRIARSPEERGMRLEIGAGERSLKDFYRLHARTRRRLGVPVQPRRFFELLWSRVLSAGLGYSILLYRDEVPVAGSVFLAWNRTVVYKYSASEPDYWRLAPNILMLWAAIKRACEEGFSVFDFGRSEADNLGLREFKSGWGAREEALPVWHLGEPARPRTQGTAGRLLRTVLQHSPGLVSRVTGELLYRYFP